MDDAGFVPVYRCGGERGYEGMEAGSVVVWSLFEDVHQFGS